MHCKSIIFAIAAAFGAPARGCTSRTPPERFLAIGVRRIVRENVCRMVGENQ